MLRYPSSARDGNICEAVNLSVSLFDNNYIDRSLAHTGENIMVLSAGIGYIELNERLARVTEHRMVDSGISCDLVNANK